MPFSFSFFGAFVCVWALLILVGCGGPSGSSGSSGGGKSSGGEASDTNLTIESGPINLSNYRMYRLFGVCHSDGEVVAISFGDNTLSWVEHFFGYKINNYLTGRHEVNCEEGQWELDHEIDFDFLPDEELVMVFVSHGGGGLRVDLLKDTTPPFGALTVDIVSNIINSENVGSFYLSGTCPEEGQVRISSGRETFSTGACVEDAGGGTWSWSLDTNLESLNDGSALLLTFDFEDLHGNATVSSSIVTINVDKDVVPPTLMVDELEVVNSSTVALTGNCRDGDGQVSIDVVGGVLERVDCDYIAGRWSYPLGMVRGEVFSASVYYSDTAGNTAEVVVDPIIRDVDAPAVVGDYAVADGIYAPGGVLSFVITYSEEVFVQGTPSLTFSLGNSGSVTQKMARYTEGSGSTQLIFSYAISYGDLDRDGIEIGADAINYGPASLLDRAGNAIVRNPAAIVFSNVTIETSLQVAATVDSFGTDVQKTFKQTESIVITAALHGSVEITEGNGPYLSLSLGEHIVIAPCVPTTCAPEVVGLVSELQFSYEVETGMNASSVSVVGMDFGGLALGMGVLFPSTLSGVAVDTDPPIITGLSNGVPSVQEGRWEWGCEDASFPCRYRSVVNQDMEHSWSTESFGTDFTATTPQEAASGMWSLHLQAQDALGNQVEATVSVEIDNIAPAVVVGEEASVPPAGEYGRGDILEFRVPMSEAISVNTDDGFPRLALSLGGGIRHAAFYEVSDDRRTLVFRYEIMPNDEEATGVVLSSPPEIERNGGVITDGAGNAVASPRLSGITWPDLTSSENIITIDKAPYVVGVARADTDKQNYKVGDDLTINVTFDEGVVVSGQPYLLLDVNGSRVRAAHEGGAASAAEQSFVFKVGAPANTDNGISVSSLVLDRGGAIQDESGNAAVIDFQLVSFSNLVLDSIFPKITEIDEGERSAQMISWSWGCSESSCSFRWAINQTPAHSFDDGNDLFNSDATASLDEAPEENGVYYLHLQLEDAVGNRGQVAHYAIRYDTTAPLPVALTVPDDGAYVYEQSLRFSVRFDDVVTVDSSEGVPSLQIRLRTVSEVNDPSQLVEVPYVEGGGTDTLVFSYEIAFGMTDRDGIEVLETYSIKFRGHCR